MSELLVDPLSDIPEVFRPVVQQYGREMFHLVMQAGLAGQAAKVLGELTVTQRNPALMGAMVTLVNSFNLVSNAYCKAKEWDEGTVAQCDRDVQLAFAGQILTPTASIILDS